MNCDLVRDLLPLYLDAELATGTRKAVRSHLSGCPACRSFFRSLLAERKSAALSPPAASFPRTAPDGYPALARRLALRRLRYKLAMCAVLSGAVFFAASVLRSKRR